MFVYKGNDIVNLDYCVKIELSGYNITFNMLRPEPSVRFTYESESEALDAYRNIKEKTNAFTPKKREVKESPKKISFGAVCGSVKLFPDEYDKLVGEYGHAIVDKNIEAMDVYDKVYKDHYKALHRWCKKDKPVKDSKQVRIKEM